MGGFSRMLAFSIKSLRSNQTNFVQLFVHFYCMLKYKAGHAHYTHTKNHKDEMLFLKLASIYQRISTIHSESSLVEISRRNAVCQSLSGKYGLIIVFFTVQY